MSKIIGIDLGTTNSCVAILDGKNVKIIENAEGSRTTPSVVSFSENEILVGSTAKRQAVTNPENTIYEVKRFMGKKLNDFKADDVNKYPYSVIANDSGDAAIKLTKSPGTKSKSPAEISAEILKRLKKAAESYLGSEVKEAVITVPAYFNDAERQATKDAARIAGLDVKRIINEPTAAALAYGLDNAHKESKIIVYDLGGGTFDVSVLHIGDGVTEVLSTNGDTLLGGGDFDAAIIDYLIEEYKKQHGSDLKKNDQAFQRIKEAAENAKKELSSSTQAHINLPFISADASGPKHLDITITRSKFESLVSDLIDKSLDCCKKAMADAKLSNSDIDEIVLVGGMTRMPKVQEMVEKFFGKKANKSVNPDEVVAHGAAVQAGVLSGDVKDVLLLDVTPLSLGIETMGGVFTKLIERNTTVPTKKSQVFSTAEDNQTAVSIRIFQGERPMAADNKLLGTFELSGIAPAPKGTPQIEVTFDIDSNGIIGVSAKDKATNKSQQISIKSDGGLSDEDIKKIIEEAESMKATDEAKVKLIDAKNKADMAIGIVDKSLKEHADKINDELKKKVEDSKASLQEALKGDDLDDITKKTESLNNVSMEIGKTIYEQQKEGEKSDSTDKPSDDDKKE